MYLLGKWRYKKSKRFTFRLRIVDRQKNNIQINDVKGQHYVPRTYLKHFSLETSEEFFIYMLQIKEYEERNIKKICLENDLYTLHGTTTQERMLIEKFYSDEIEKHYDEIYNILVDPDKKTINDGERELIIATVVTMLYRTTKMKNRHNSVMYKTLEQIYELCNRMDKTYFADKTLDNLYKEHKNTNRPMQMMLQLEIAFKLVKIRLSRDGIVVIKLENDDCEFITSDNPVLYSSIETNLNSPFNPENILCLPIDNKHVLLLMPYADKHPLIYTQEYQTRKYGFL